MSKSVKFDIVASTNVAGDVVTVQQTVGVAQNGAVNEQIDLKAKENALDLRHFKTYYISYYQASHVSAEHYQTNYVCATAILEWPLKLFLVVVLCKQKNKKQNVPTV